jgi:predicted MPP superfamily phosphohydrolase
MAFSFSFDTANWLAYLIEPEGQIPLEIESHEAKETLRLFLDNMSVRFMSSLDRQQSLASLSRETSKSLMGYRDYLPRSSAKEAIKDIRSFFADRPWTALIIPSGYNPEADSFLCSADFLSEIVEVCPNAPGLILQLDTPPEKEFSLLDIFPAFKVALSESDQWPGILLWSRFGDSVYLPFESNEKNSIIANSHWILNYLASSIGIDFGLLKSRYFKSFPLLSTKPQQKLNILHLSDLHIGSKHANLRLSRVRQLIENVVEGLDNSVKLVPVITGDIMDTPDESCHDGVRQFLGYISSLFEERPLVVLGNHDVRRSGFLSEDLRQVLQIRQPGMKWFDQEKVGIACFNSVTKGSFARGFIGERQYLDFGDEIDSKKDWQDYTLISLLHHHPLSVPTPSWYAKNFYERIFKGTFKKTLELKDAKEFIDFTESRDFAMVLHGHKHIPRYTNTNSKKIPVIGCGSTSGKVATTDGSTYMSLNIYSIDTLSHRVIARLLAERIPGGGLTQSKRHEIVYRS